MPPSAKGQRLDRFLADALSLSRSRIQALMEQGHISPAKASLKLEGGERISVHIPAAAPTTVSAEDIPLTLVYEDADVAVINKPPGLTVHPSSTQRSGTLVNALLGKLHSLSGIGGELRPGIVHRLDKDTSGLLIVAKNDAAHQHLTAAFAERRITKIYLAYVWGHPPAQGEWKQPIGRHPTDRKRFSTKAKQAKIAHTRFTNIVSYRDAAKLRIELLTGRTHQIRVHAADNGFPLIGDKTYGKRKSPISRQALHAFELTLTLPNGKTRTFTAEEPTDLQALHAELAAR